jgi:hypothetical protein
MLSPLAKSSLIPSVKLNLYDNDKKNSKKASSNQKEKLSN